MKKLLFALTLLSFAMLGTAAMAQDPGDVGIFFDPAGTQTTGTITPFVPFTIYLVAFDLPGGVAGHEGSLQTNLAPSAALVSSIILGPAPLKVGGPLNWICGLGGCVPGGGPVLLAEFTFLATIPQTDVLFSVGPSTPSSFAPAAPGWLTCGSDIIPFGVAVSGNGEYPDGASVGNPTGLAPVAVQEESWGGVKSLFR